MALEPMTVLSQLGLAGGIVGAAILLLRELKRLGNGKLDRLFSKLEAIEQRLDKIEQGIAYERGREAERTGRYQAQRGPNGETLQ